jgi:hypothetical protein
MSTVTTTVVVVVPCLFVAACGEGPQESPSSVAGTWMVTLYQDDGTAIEPPEYVVVTESGSAIELADVTDPEDILATGDVDGDTLTLVGTRPGAPEVRHGIIGRNTLTADVDSDFSGMLLTWSAERIQPPQIENGAVVADSVALINDDSENAGASALTDSGLAHLNAAASSLLPMGTEPTGPLGDATNTCTKQNGAGVTCPAPGAQREGITVCTTQNWGLSEIRDLANRVAFADDANIFPGAVLQGQAFSEGNFVRVNAARAGGTLLLSGLALENGAYSTAVDAMTPSEVKDGIAAIIGPDSNVQGTAAQLSLDVQSAYSSDQLAFSFGVDGRYGGASLNTAFNLDQKKTSNTVVLKFTQVYYTVSYEPPDGTPRTIFFRDGDEFTDPDSTIGPGNPPLYVSSVSYGRQIFFAMTSEYSANEMSAVLQGAYSNAAGSLKVSSGATYAEVAASSQVSYVVRGGSAGLAVQPINAGSPDQMYAKIQDLIAEQKAANYSSSNPGVVVAYTAKYIQTRRVARMSYSVTYDQSDCRFLAAVPYNIEFQAWNIDDDVYVWKTSVNDANRIFYTNGDSGEVNLTGTIGSEGEQFIIKVGNAGCFQSRADLAVTVDGQQKWRLSMNHNWWCDCGWQVDTHLTVNKNTGAVTETYRWVAYGG